MGKQKVKPKAKAISSKGEPEAAPLRRRLLLSAASVLLLAVGCAVLALRWPRHQERRLVGADGGPEAKVAAAGSNAARLKQSANLLRALQEAGATLLVPIVAEVTGDAGLAVFTNGNVSKGTSILTIPAELMLREPGADESGEVGLALALAREKQHPSSDLMSLYLASLPGAGECPANLVGRSKADLKLASASMHKWRVDMLSSGRSTLAKYMPEMPTHELSWVLCMVLSRAFTQTGKGTVMIPYVDLLNHNRNPSAYHVTHPDKAVVVASRDLKAGEELTFEYLASPSRARLLTSFGFETGAPALSLAANDLEHRDEAWLERYGCSAVPRVDLEPNTDGTLDDNLLRAALRCIRLRLYTVKEAEWAESTGHLDAPWEGSAVTAADGMLFSVLTKDNRIVKNTGVMCQDSLPQTELAMNKFRQKLEHASADLQKTIRDETAALMGCSMLLQQIHMVLNQRLGRQRSPPSDH